ncbi:MAG: Ig-like domain-containing protein [Eubacteriales bacterium]
MKTRNFIRRIFIIISLLALFMTLMPVNIFAAPFFFWNFAPVISQGTSIDLNTNENTPGDISLSATDRNNDPLTWSASSAAQNGAASVAGSGNNAFVTYTPEAGYFGSDSFKVKVSDGRATDTITVNVKVNSSSVNHAPVISVSSISLNTDQNKPVSTAVSATDADNDVLTWSISSSPINGSAVVNPPVTGTSVSVTYTPATNFIGTDSFNVGVSDGKGETVFVAVTVQVTAIAVPSTLNYVALGDSIATGTIYSGKTITTYVTYFHQYLIAENPGASVTLQNFSTDGDRTNELLSKIINNTSGIVDAIKSADVITISIGGNNLMQAAKDSTALGGYNFNKINTAVAQQGMIDFAGQFPQIIDKIKEYNPSSKIIVMSVYNPYNESDSALHNTVDSFLFCSGAGINDIIYNYAGAIYKVADAFSAFDAYAKANNMKAVTYFYASDFWGNLTRNPHPNAAGQNILTQLHQSAYDLF